VKAAASSHLIEDVRRPFLFAQSLSSKIAGLGQNADQMHSIVRGILIE
jgi:hypothetical protein